MENRMYIQVIIPLRLEWEPCYVAMEPVQVGDRVRVLFSNKEYVAVVSAVDVQPDVALSKVKPILCVEKDMERVRLEEIELWRQVAEYYLCTVGEVCKAAYPAMKVNLEEARAVALAKARERRERLLSSMKAKADKLQERMDKKQEALAKSRPGTKTHTGHQESFKRLQNELETALAAIDNFEKNLKGGSDSLADESLASGPEINLSDAQSSAYNEIVSGFSAGKPVLLHGVTGSGKTQIYIKLALETLTRGRGVLYLVPEIALSRQLQDRLYEHFGEKLLVFHSGESAASRRNTADLIRNAAGGYIVLGTRSSLFLPHHDLGLIIVDEEHDSSYKQDSPAPRYNGRDTALMLAAVQNRSGSDPCNVIMGSATPSFEEMYNCSFGRHVLIRLAERYHGADSSEIQIIDTRAERRKRGMEGSFSRKLIEAIREVLGKGQQVMLLRSRRAWAPALQCEGCGEIVKCPHCNVSMTLHKGASGDFMACHYCGHKASFSGKCTKCSGVLKPLGAGTQKIEEEAIALFPDARIARLDSDTSSDKKYEARIIKDFGRGDIDILIGTQMLAKGFDFSNLSLVAVLAADTLLGMHDFRADEKALQLLEQFRGRCGRRGESGLFIIQTSQPEHPVYSRLAVSDSLKADRSIPDAAAMKSEVLNDMLQERRDFNFPPFSRIVGISIHDTYEDRVQRMASRLAGLLNQHFGTTGARRTALEASPVTGPYAPVVDKIADKYIRTIRISLRKDRSLKTHKAAIREIVNSFEKNERYIGHIAIDVDPV
jgi:primosomal protein N' (replication factor Y)